MTKKMKTAGAGGGGGGGGGGSEFFICFTKMRVPSSKSLMSPGRNRDPAAPSLSASLSRRLRSSGSIKGGQSPGMFPASGTRKKGSAFEAVEPSSPKVTCIGQVRVKSKKKKKKNNSCSSSKSKVVVRSRSQRVAGEVSFREQEKRNQNWVHQLNCFLPCRSACFSNDSTVAAAKEEEKKRSGNTSTSSSSSSCGAVFARWLMAIDQDVEQGKRREVVGLIVEKKKEEDVVFAEAEAEEEEEEEQELQKEEEGTVSMCIPPKNALLLMRCRSDPVKMAALANKFWGSPNTKVGQCEEEYEDEDDHENGQHEVCCFEKENVDLQTYVDEVKDEEDEVDPKTEQASLEAEVENEEMRVVSDVTLEKENVNPTVEEAQKQLQQPTEMEREILCLGVSVQSPIDVGGDSEGTVEKKEMKVVICSTEKELEAEDGEESRGRRTFSCSASKSSGSPKTKLGKKRSYSTKERRRNSFSSEKEARRHSFSSEREARRASFSTDKEGRRSWSFSLDKEDIVPKEKTKTEKLPAEKEARKTIEAKTKEKNQVKREEKEVNKEVKEREERKSEQQGEKKRRELPDCLLLMMYEPKLSMEVSKETWVCSNDFFQWRSQYAPPLEAKPEVGEATANESCSQNKGEATPTIQDSEEFHPSPAPPPPPTALAEEQKPLIAAVATQATVLHQPIPTPPKPYEPFVLTRCKSEPLKSSARLAQDAGFWKSRHRPIGAAGIGF